MKSDTKLKAAQVALLFAAASLLSACGGGSPQPQNQPQQNAPVSGVPVAVPIAQPISSPIAAPVVQKPLQPVTPPPAVVVQTATSIDFTPNQIVGASDMIVSANSFQQSGLALPVGAIRYSNLSPTGAWILPTTLQSIPLCNTPAAVQSPANPLATCTTVLTGTFTFVERDAAGITLASGSVTF